MLLRRTQPLPVILTRRKINYLADVKLPPKTVYNMEEHGVTQTMLKNGNCRLRLILWLNGWYLPEKEYKMSWGSMFHELLDKLYTFHKKREVIPANEFLVGWALQYYKELHKELPCVDQDKEDLDIVKALVILRNYILAYAEDFTEQKSTLVESSFAVKFFDFLLRGKIDREFTKQGNLWLMEHKTKGKIDEGQLLDLLGFNFQNMFYSLARLLSGGILYKGIEYNIIRNSSSKLSVKKQETLEDFEERFEADVKKRPQHYYKRYTLSFHHEKEIETFKCNLRHRLEETSLLLDGKLPVYPNPFTCEDPWPCPYIRACSSGVLTGYRQKEKLFEELEEI